MYLSDVGIDRIQYFGKWASLKSLQAYVQEVVAHRVQTVFVVRWLKTEFHRRARRAMGNGLVSTEQIPFAEAEDALTQELLELIDLAGQVRQGLQADGPWLHATMYCTPYGTWQGPAMGHLYGLATQLEDRLIALEIDIDHTAEQVQGSPVYPRPDSVPMYRGSSTDQLPTIPELAVPLLYTVPGHHCTVCDTQWAPEDAPFGGVCPTCPGQPQLADGRRPP